ncbi:hypothetical protein MTR67_026786 [Solanum verrucosum]|uniref:Uncharacterized protein n=1 Tax=Solanum verrucosum TaxID=315347 RepID=A0AAF0R7Y9_SOLVR|nr:hypothetical protein MTR67_026786 [Solanum verrucosum]
MADPSLARGNNEIIVILSIRNNKFSGHILLKFVAFQNKLTGNIPTSTQFQTKVDPTIFQGNVALCGPPLTEYVGDGTTTTSQSGRNDEGETDGEDKLEKVWFFAVVGLGYCHDQSLHPGCGWHSRTIDGPQANPHPG